MAIRQLNVKGRTYCFNNDLINIKNFNSNNLRVFWAMMFIILDISQKTHCGMLIV